MPSASALPAASLSPGPTPVVVVIGGGVSGLTAAYEIRRTRPDIKVVLLESRERLGGNVQTKQVGGFLVDAGPDAFVRTKPWGLELCLELGLRDELIQPLPSARGVYVARAGRLQAMPEGLMLGMPTRVEPLLRTPLLSLPGKLRMLAEFSLPRGYGLGNSSASSGSSEAVSDESLASFVSRRFGAEAAQNLVTPLLAGIYAGAADQLSARATFPQLCDLEDQYGSITFGLLQSRRLDSNPANSNPGHTNPAAGSAIHSRRSASRARRSRLQCAREFLARRSAPQVVESPFLSLRGGLSTLIEALAEQLDSKDIRRGSRVEGLTYAPTRHPGSGSWVVRTQAETLRAHAVIVTAPAHAAARLLPNSTLARELDRIRYESTATVFFGLSKGQLRRPLDASGFIVPPGEGGLLAATWISSKWEARADADHVLVRAFLGGACGDLDIPRSSDGYLLDIARFELERLMGPLGPARYAEVFRHTAANPQPGLLHRSILSGLRRELSRFPGLFLSGAAYDGVSLPDCVRQARAAARSAIDSLTTSPSTRAA